MPNRTDFHPHDRFVAKSVREFARIERQLRLFEQQTNVQGQPIILYLQRLVPWKGLSAPTEEPLKALWRLLHEGDFIDLLPFILEKFNTLSGYTELPNRGRLRNLDRRVLNTYYTPLDLARWLASQTSGKACAAVRNVLIGGDGNAEEALRQLISLRVCDLSCGAGILLREALEPIASTYKQIYEVLGNDAGRFANDAPLFSRGHFKLQALKSNVYGIDISPQAVESARTVLAVWAADEMRSARMVATDVARWLEPNIRVGSGSHWSIGIEDVHGSTVEVIRLAATERTKACEEALHLRGPLAFRSEFEIAAMFPEVFMGPNPGFSCIVGNPPFGKLPEGVDNSECFGPSDCFSFGVRQQADLRWQYPKFVEGLYKLTRHESYSAIITPLNLAYGREFANLRGTVEKAPLRSTFVFFDRSPDALFGDKVKTRNTVLLVEPSKHQEPEIRTTHLLRWTRVKRADIWRQVRPVDIPGISIGSFVPKLGTPLEVECWRKLRSRRHILDSGVLNPESERSIDTTVYVYGTAYNWLPAFRHIPTDDKSLVSPSMRTYDFNTETDADLVYSCLVSSIAFWLWTVESDGFHLTDAFILGLPFVPDAFSSEDTRLMSQLAQAHDTAIRSNPTVKSNAGLKVLNFNRQCAAHISHQIDEVIIRTFGLPPELLALVRERVQNLVFVGRQKTRAATSPCLQSNHLRNGSSQP
jgi:hypothetical protein